MNNKLSLIVNFIGIDKMSGAMKNIVGLGEKGSAALRRLNGDARKMTRELRDVRRELGGASGNITTLVERERQLETALKGVNRQIERQKSLASINARTARMTARGEAMVASGQSGLFGTAFLAAPFLAAAKAGADFQSYQSRMRVLGLGRGAVDDLTAFANAMNIAGSSVSDNMRYLLEAQGVFRETGEHSLAQQLAGAKLMAPLLARMHVVGKATGNELSEDQERYFLRFVEQAGGLTSSKRAAALTDGLFRALQSSGGNVQAADYQSFLARAGVAGQHLSARSMFADFEPLIGELHQQAGVGLATGFKMATGIRVNSRAANDYMRLGIWDPSKVVLNSLGNVKTTKGNPLRSRAADLLQHDPVEFYRQIVLPAYARGGINTSEGRAFENARLFGNTGGNLFSLIDKQLPTILRSRLSYQKTERLDKAYNDTSNSFFGKEGKLRAAAKDFMVAAGTKGGLLDNVVSLMTSATSALRNFTAFGNAHPTAFRWIGKIATDLLLVKGGLAVTRLAFGGLLGPAAKLWSIWSKYRELGSIAAIFPRLARVFGVVRTAALFMGRGVLRAGLMMLANPMVLAITAIVAALAVAGYLIYRNWDKIKAAFTTGWNYVKSLLSGAKDWMGEIGRQMMQGLLIALNPVLLANKLLSIARSGITAFKNFFGIKSPSRLFMTMGGHITDGLAIGIDRGRHAPARAIGRMAAGTARAGAMNLKPMRRARGSAGVRGASGPVTVHVHGAPGQSPDELARAVIRRLENVQRKKRLASYEETEAA